MTHEENLRALMLGALAGVLITQKDLMLPFKQAEIDLVFKAFLSASSMQFRHDSIELAKKVLNPGDANWDQLDILAKRLLEQVKK